MQVSSNTSSSASSSSSSSASSSASSSSSSSVSSSSSSASAFDDAARDLAGFPAAVGGKHGQRRKKRKRTPPRKPRTGLQHFLATAETLSFKDARSKIHLHTVHSRSLSLFLSLSHTHTRNTPHNQTRTRFASNPASIPAITRCIPKRCSRFTDPAPNSPPCSLTHAVHTCSPLPPTSFLLRVRPPPLIRRAASLFTLAPLASVFRQPSSIRST